MLTSSLASECASLSDEAHTARRLTMHFGINTASRADCGVIVYHSGRLIKVGYPGYLYLTRRPSSSLVKPRIFIPGSLPRIFMSDSSLTRVRLQANKGGVPGFDVFVH